MEKIKTTLIGAGYRGKQLLQFLQNFPFFEVMAVADPYIEETDIPEIVCYNNGEEDYLNMLDRLNRNWCSSLLPGSVMLAMQYNVWRGSVILLWR